MDDLFTVLIILFIIVGPLLDKLLKGRRPAPQQRPQRPRRGEPFERRELPDDRTRTMSGPAADTEPARQDASDLLPAELWEILTGRTGGTPRPEQRAPAEPEPSLPTERPSAAERRAEAARRRAAREAREAVEARSARAGRPLDEEEAAAAVMRRRERTQAARRRYDHTPPTVVSLESEPPPEPIRHAAFHERLDRLPKPARRRKPAPPIALDLDPADQTSLQRAILLQEVLGRPRGLD